MSDLARNLIAQNRASRAKFLDLGNCELTELPQEVGDLEWLESVSLANRWTEWDGQVWRIRSSRNAGANNNWVVDIALLGRLTPFALGDLGDGR